MQLDFLNDSSLNSNTPLIEPLDFPDANIVMHRHFLPALESDDLLATIINETSWRQDHLNFGGKKVPIPRLQAWMGDVSSEYGYSGLKLKRLPWSTTILRIKAKIEAQTSASFNSVLLNYYRDGNDSVAWHSDDEKELGADPIIASLSLGTTRLFEFKHRYLKPTLKYDCALTHGSLLLMGAGLQQNWQHQVPKQKEIIDGRVNLTFRKIIL
jgi:alkylated DNA repair dioxygenase AlkB